MCKRKRASQHRLPFLQFLASALSQILQKIFRRTFVEAGEDLCQVFIAKMIGDGFTQHLPEICCHREIAAFIELFRLKAGPVPIHSAAFNRTTQNKHHVGMAVVCTAISILSCCAPKL